jgi:hypothetical protein
MSRVEIHLDIDELHRVIGALQAEGSEECQDLADRLLYTTDFTRKQLIDVYGCDPKQVKASTVPSGTKHWGDGKTHYFRLCHPVVSRLMQESKNPAANWIIAQYLECDARFQASYAKDLADETAMERLQRLQLLITRFVPCWHIVIKSELLIGAVVMPQAGV